MKQINWKRDYRPPDFLIEEKACSSHQGEKLADDSPDAQIKKETTSIVNKSIFKYHYLSVDLITYSSYIIFSDPTTFLGRIMGKIFVCVFKDIHH